MKKIFLLTILLSFILNTTDLNAQGGNQTCTRAWLNSVNFINTNYINSLADCATSTVFNWISIDVIGAIYDMGCAMDATWIYYQVLDNAAIQYEACYL